MVRNIEDKNAVNGEVNIVDGQIQTTKKNPEIHGLGLNSIKEIVKKYNGNMIYSQKEGEFIADVIMQNII